MVLDSENKESMKGLPTRIVSGGQTGIDQGALLAALMLNLDFGGWAPRGFITEKGLVPTVMRERMRESESPMYFQRTRYNVQDANATIVIYRDNITPGSWKTISYCEELKKPYARLRIWTDLSPAGYPKPNVKDLEKAVAKVRNLFEKHRIRTLNIAGSRNSKWPGCEVIPYLILKQIYLQENINA